MRLQELCDGSGIALVPVPADGNCLAWALHVLLVGLQHYMGADDQNLNQEQQFVRTMIKGAWESNQDSDVWQLLFQAYYPEHCTDPVGATPLTPEKKDGGTAAPGEAPVDLITPPRTDLPETMKKSRKRIGEAKAMGFGKAKQGPSSETPVKKPTTTKYSRLLEKMEKGVPDLEEAFYEAMSSEAVKKEHDDSKAVKQEPDCADDQDDDDDRLSISSEEVDPTGRKRRHHARRCKKKFKASGNCNLAP